MSEKHTLFSTIIVGRICDMSMCVRQMAREIRAKNMQVLHVYVYMKPEAHGQYHAVCNKQ